MSIREIYRFLFICCSCIVLLMRADFSRSELPSSPSGSRENMMAQIENDLSRERELFLKYESKEKDLLEQLAVIEKDIEEKKDLLKGLRDKLGSTRTDLESSQKKLEKIEVSLASKEELLGKRLAAFYKYAKQGYLQVLASAKDLDHLNHSMKYLAIIMDEDRRVMKEMMDDQQQYLDEVSRVKNKLTIIDELEKAESEKLESVKEALDKKILFLAKIHQEKEFYETAVKELQSAAEDLRSTLLGFEKNQTEVKELPSGFSNAKGKLSPPLKGSVVKSNNIAPGNENLLKGVYINSNLGEDVRAVYPGRVEFSGQLKGYGQVVIINHGSRYFTISGYLSEIARIEDDAVSAGDIVGKVGETGLSSGPGLYFEIREGGVNLDPLEWLKVN